MKHTLPRQEIWETHYCPSPFLIFTLALVISLLAVDGVQSKEPKAGQEILSQVLEEALREHPAVKARKSERVAANLDLEGSRWARYPSLAIEAQIDEANNDGQVARIIQPIWAGGRISNQIEFSEARLLQSDALLEQTQQEVLLQTSAVFYESLRVNARLDAAKENVKEHEKLLELIVRRVKSEVSPETDRVLAEARLQLARNEEIQVRRTLQTLQQNLAQLVGRQLSSLATPPPVTLKPYSDIDELIKLAMNFSPERKRVLAQVDASVAQVGLAKAASMPTLVAGYQRSWGSGTDPADQEWRGYVGFQFQPGSGLSSVTGAKAAEFRRQAALESVEAVDRQLSSQIRSALNEFDALSGQLSPANLLFKATSEVLESYIRQYQIGRKSWIDVLNAQREKIQAKTTLADVGFSVELAKLRLMLLTGDIRPETLSTIHD